MNRKTKEIINKIEIIDKIEILLLGWKKFDEARRRILLDNNNSFQVQACPWSWKTTLLVAKLMFLAQTIDFSKESICILTHTNVAVDEIKKKIKKHSKPWYEDFINNVYRLFDYPNFVWTIQSFLDKYLWVPWYEKIYKKKPNSIWDEFLDKNFLWLDYNIISDKVEATDNKLKNRLKYKWTYNYKKYVQIQNFWKLSYKEIDYFSKKHLEESENIKKLLQKRFKYVFLDEIQDTHSLHVEILNKLYEWWENIIQWFWDYNQEIFYNDSKSKESNNNSKSKVFTIFWNEEPRQINNSMRLSSIIAKNVKNVCIKPQELKWISWRNIPIYFIVFDKPEDVITKYLEIIREHKEDFIWIEKDDLIFKAIWWTWKEDDEKTKKKKEEKGKKEKLHIWKYWNKYNNWKIIKSKTNLFSYFQKVDKKEFKNKWYLAYKDIIISWILHAFNHDENNQIKTDDWKFFSKTTFISYLKEKGLYNDFQKNIFKFANQIENESWIIWEDVKEYILNLEINWKKVKNDNFLKNKVFWTPEELSNISTDNKDTENTIQIWEIETHIQFATIAKVKWETHTGTLVLDTDYNKETSARILEHWENDNEYTKWWDIAKSLKNYYVAITRPTHLLCIAVRKNRKNISLVDKICNWKNIEIK